MPGLSNFSRSAAPSVKLTVLSLIVMLYYCAASYLFCTSCSYAFVCIASCPGVWPE